MRHNFEDYDNISILTHADMDGDASYANMIWAIKKSTDKPITVSKTSLHHIHSGSDSSDDSKFRDAISKNGKNLIIVLDYAFSSNTEYLFEEIYKATEGGKHLLWIDHHDSSIKFVEEYCDIDYPNGDFSSAAMTNPHNHYLMDADHILVCKAGSAAYLTWAYNNSDKFSGLVAGTNCYDMYGMAKQTGSVPDHIKYVSDYDTWQYKYTITMYFKYAYDMAPNKDLFFFKYEEIEYDSPKYYEAMFNDIEAGKAISSYVDSQNAATLKSHGYESYIPNHIIYGKAEDEYECTAIYVINHYGNSTVFGEKYHEYPYVVIWYFTGELYMHSIYSDIKKFTDTDCEAIASKFGGGGHRGAAGWTSRSLMFAERRFFPPIGRIPKHYDKGYRSVVTSDIS